MKAAAVQLNSGADAEANIAAADRHVRAAAADGARLVVLPEKWTVMGGPAELRAGAQRSTAPRSRGRERRLASWSWISWRARSPSASRTPRSLSNTSVHVGPDGELRAVYRKLHMFDVEVDGQPYCESDSDEPGEEFVTSELADGTKLGLSICYDVRFPECAAILALRGARVIALPAAFTLLDHTRPLAAAVRARAIENQVFVVAANQVGAHPADTVRAGSSMIVDPWGACSLRPRTARATWWQSSTSTARTTSGSGCRARIASRRYAGRSVRRAAWPEGSDA